MADLVVYETGNGGDVVKQGSIIGYIGMTGNTSGPHVCYRFWKYGRQVDPFREKLPSAEPLDPKIKPAYFKFIAPMKNQLDGVKLHQRDTLSFSPSKEKELLLKH